MGKIDYNYSNSNVGSGEALGSNIYGPGSWKQPTFDYGHSNKDNFEFNFSALSNVAE